MTLLLVITFFYVLKIEVNHMYHLRSFLWSLLYSLKKANWQSAQLYVTLSLCVVLTSLVLHHKWIQLTSKINSTHCILENNKTITIYTVRLSSTEKNQYYMIIRLRDICKYFIHFNPNTRVFEFVYKRK